MGSWNLLHKRGALAFAMTALLAVTPVAAQEEGAAASSLTPEQITEATQIDGARIEAADSEPGNWMAHGRTYSEQRYSPLDQITTENVGELGLAWTLETNTDRGVEATPIVVDGVMYTTASWSKVFAIDARNGDLIWEFDPKVPREWGKKACCDVVNRGVAVWKGRVYVGTIDGRLIALDAATGDVVWDINTIDRTRPYTITGAPRVVKGNVIIGNGGAELGVRGYFSAYDAETGELKWRFYTVPGNPDDPVEHPALEAALPTWSMGEDYDGPPWWEVGGGGTVWDSMAYDPELDLMYVGVGNGSPWSRVERSPGGGDNLYLSSVLAIRPDTGELVWHYQHTPGDTWDYTSTQHIVLADMTIDGRERKVLMQAPKNGFFYVIDRETGELLSADAYVTVNWASGVDLETGRPIETEEGDWSEDVKVVYPSPLGGHNWHPTAYNPNTGLVYIPAMDIAGVYGPVDFEYKPGEWNTGNDTAAGTDVPPDAVSGYLLAWDPKKKEAAWRLNLAGPWNGGILTTAGNLVFQGTADGRFVAYNAENGEILWQAAAPTGIVAPPVTYEVDGEQYVTVMAGWGGAYALAFGRAAKAAGVTENFGRVLTFKIGGDAEMPAKAEAEEPPAPPEMTGTPEQIKMGEAAFHNYCAVCHGIGAVSGGVLPDLRYADEDTHAAWDEIVLGGVLAGNGMVSHARYVSEEESAAIHAYVIKRAHEGDAPAVIAAPEMDNEAEEEAAPEGEEAPQ